MRQRNDRLPCHDGIATRLGPFEDVGRCLRTGFPGRFRGPVAKARYHDFSIESTSAVVVPFSGGRVGQIAAEPIPEQFGPASVFGARVRVHAQIRDGHGVASSGAPLEAMRCLRCVPGPPPPNRWADPPRGGGVRGGEAPPDAFGFAGGESSFGTARSAVPPSAASRARPHRTGGRARIAAGGPGGAAPPRHVQTPSGSLVRRAETSFHVWRPLRHDDVHDPAYTPPWGVVWRAPRSARVAGRNGVDQATGAAEARCVGLSGVELREGRLGVV